MTEAEASFGAAFLDFLTSIGVGFGDVVILIVLFGAGWLIYKGKLRIGNGNGNYASDDSVKDLSARMDRHFKVVEGVREDLGELSARVAKLEGSFEQYRSK